MTRGRGAAIGLILAATGASVVPSAAARTQDTASRAGSPADARLRVLEQAREEAGSLVADLARRPRAAPTRLDQRARVFISLLSLIERLSRYPAETLLAAPLRPEQATRAVTALQALARALAADKAAPRDEDSRHQAPRTGPRHAVSRSDAGIAAPRGQLMAPVAGTVIRAFGASDDAGPSNGMSVQAPPSARVVSPCGGRVAFAGPFRTYGKLLIIDCGGGEHVVLAGLDHLSTTIGQTVRPGEPVGVMPARDPRGPGGRPSLYVELRQRGEPVNPAPFLRAKG